MGDISVRQAVLSDLPYLYEICLKTGDSGKDASALFNDPYLIGHYYAAPYLVFQKGVCFVAEYEKRPNGYIVAAPDTAAFNRWMEENWLPPLRKQFLQNRATGDTKKEEDIINLIHKQHHPADSENQTLLTDYPAHLHIDLLPVIQKKGIGKILIDNLLDELRQQNIPGLHLGVTLSNPGAICFYQKMNFGILQKHDWGYTMGRAV
jgi:ribosomal protein S18 acetylase RimI-like enzyme